MVDTEGVRDEGDAKRSDALREDKVALPKVGVNSVATWTSCGISSDVIEPQQGPVAEGGYGP